VDLARFAVRDRRDARRRLDLPEAGVLLLAVGNLLELKGHHLMIEALAGIDGATLLILGEGPRRQALAALASRLGLETRVRLPGIVAQDVLVDYYAAADVTLLASSREGMPNVVLESLACGTPVVATAVGGVPDVVDAPAAGRLVAERTAGALRAAIDECLAAPAERAATRRHAERFAWGPVVERQIATLRAVAGAGTIDGVSADAH